MLREREGERLDAWLDRVEKQGVPELQSFAEATEKRLRCGKSGPHTLVEQRLRCIMHLVTRITIISTRSVVVDPPEEEERDTIHDHCSTLPQCFLDDTSAKSFEQ